MSLRIIFAWVWVLVVCLLLTHNVYLWLGKGIAPDTDILALLPVQERDPALQQAFTRMVDSSQQRLIVLVGADDWAHAHRAAAAYVDVLARYPDLLQSADPVTHQRDWVAFFQTHRLALLTPKAEEDLRSRPKQYWTEIALTKLYSPFAGLQLGAWRDDPFGLFGGWIQARAQETPVRPRDGQLFVSDGQRHYAVIPFTLRVPAFSMEAQQAVMPLLEQARQAARKAVPQAEIVAAGVILYAAAAGEQARLEVSTIGFGSILGIIVLMGVTFHSLKPIALIMLSIFIGCLGALSVCWMLFERVHLLTLVFGASLIGGAQDYGTYFLCNRIAPNTQPFDSWQLLRRLLPALVLTLVTTVIGYLGLALTPFPGLRQMAVFSSLGLIFAWLTVVFWFPLLVRTGTLKSTPVAQWWAISLERWPLLRRHRSSLWAGGLFAAFAVFGFARLGVQDDVRLLQNPPKNLIDDQAKVSKLLDTPTPAQFYIVRGTTPELVLQREETLKQRLDPLVEKHIISGYHALSNWVPSVRAQAARRNLIDRTLLNDNGPLATLAAEIGESGKWVAATRTHLLSSALPLTPDDFLKTPASEPWRYLWLGQIEGGWVSIVALRGLTYTGLPKLQDADIGLDGVQWVDKVGEISHVLGRYRNTMGWVVLLSYFVVYGLLYPRYRSATWRVLAPTALASITTIALLGIAGQNLQLFHVLALMLLLGVGVDHGIFLHEHPGRRDPVAWLAVGLSALSTLLSFGLLSLSKTPALQAFGLTMLIGTITVWLIVPCFRSHRSPELEGA
ncbi:MAG TPA: MMPL family transporter [Candidatus Binatia bacterium]|nr:MMPL family transporter [Candidatus Binatia bacterium]